MKRPQDPRHHGLKEPKNLIYEKRTSPVPCGDLPQDSSTKRCYIDTVVYLLDELKKKIGEEGKAIVNSPYLCFYSDGYSRGSTCIECTTEEINKNYASEKAEYDAQIKEYEEQTLRYEEWLKNKENKINQKIDDKITHLERKLANMKAHRDGQPLPFPDN